MHGDPEPGEGLLERSGELRRIDALLGSAAGGDGGLLAIEGPAGIGKTGLLEAAAAAARDRGMAVARASGATWSATSRSGSPAGCSSGSCCAPIRPVAPSCSRAPPG
jgi:hypothetical protein